MTTYRIGNNEIDGDTDALPDYLAKVYSDKARPLCLCQDLGVEMYIAHVGETYIIKRMPNTGMLHAADCESYEPPAELSGLGQVMGSAIQEDPAGATMLRFDFSLAKGGSKAPPTPNAEQPDSVKTSGTKLTLRSTLHYLWEEAGLNKWTPGMTNKRNWYRVRYLLLQAAHNKQAKGLSLADLLFIPETYNSEQAAEIKQRRMIHMHHILANPKNAKSSRKPMMIAIGEHKGFAKAQYGHKIILKHLPDFPFFIDEELHKKIHKRFETELALRAAKDDGHLIVIATFTLNAAGSAVVDEIALMTATQNWLPYENEFDLALLDIVTDKGRSFIKGMRYNMASDKPLACAVLTDTAPVSTALYVVPPVASDDYRTAQEELIAESKIGSWVWHAGASEMSPLPEMVLRRPRTST